MSFLEVLKDGLSQWNIPMSHEQVDKLIEFNSIVMQANEHMNLTSITDGVASAKRHFLDSLNPHVIDSLKNAKKVIDVGSGAGFPGIPLAIAHPNIEFTLLDARRKRCEFMKDAISQLDLNNVIVKYGRAEVISKKTEFRETYDIACARAVAAIPVLIEYLLPFVKIGGEAVFYKAATLDDEIASAKNAVNILGGAELMVRTYTVFGENANFSIVTSKKITPSPTKYPRRSGIPSKRPL